MEGVQGVQNDRVQEGKEEKRKDHALGEREGKGGREEGMLDRV